MAGAARDATRAHDALAGEAAAATATGTAIGLQVVGYDNMMIDVETNKGLLEGDDEALKSLLADEMIPEIFDDLLEDFAVIEVPALDLGALDDTIPAGTVINFDLDSITHGPEFTNGQSAGNAYTFVQGDL